MFVLRGRLVLCVALALGLLLSVAPALAAGKGAPPGNNGTVKIDGVPFDASPGAPNRNEPHVPCDFRIEFYNYEEDSTWSVTFEAWSPTGDHSSEQVVVETGRANDDSFHAMDLNNDPAEGGDADGIDHREEYRLSFPGLEPHPEQGFHVKTTALVDDPDPRGAERKHKVFWVEPCESQAVAGEEVEQSEEEEETAEQEERRDTPPGSQNEKGEEAEPTPQAPRRALSEEVERPVTPARTAARAQPQVMGVAVERAESAAPSGPPAAQRLARTGGAGLLAPLGAALVVAGAMLQLAALFRRRRAG